MMIVIPMISSNKTLFGIYSICISTSIFLSYADLGFVSAGIKYAGEYYAKKDSNKEIQLYGFTGLVLFVFVSIISVIYLYLSFHPNILIKDLNDPLHLLTAGKLLLIQAIFSYNTVLQRFTEGVFQVRIQQYIFQRISIIGSTFKIASIYYFFNGGQYNIVGYFLYIKIIDLIIYVTSLIIIEKKFNISFKKFLQYFKFDKAIFSKTKELAVSSLAVTILWILYYELDLIIIGRVLGASSVAVFAIAFTFMKLLRTLSSVVFSPFQNRYNHFIGLKDVKGLKILVKHVISFFIPIFLFPLISIVILSNQIVQTWVGDTYLNSSIIIATLSINFMFGPIRIPGANLLIAFERIKEMYIINILMVITYWVGITFSIEYWGLNSFAFFKLISGIIAVLFYAKFFIQFLDLNINSIIKKTSIFVIPIFIQCALLINVGRYLHIDQGHLNLLIVIIFGGFTSIIGLGITYLLSKEYRSIIDINFSKLLIHN